MKRGQLTGKSRKFSEAEKEVIRDFLSTYYFGAMRAATTAKRARQMYPVECASNDLEYWTHVAQGIRWVMTHAGWKPELS